MSVPKPVEIPRAAAGDTAPVAAGGADPFPNGGDPNGGAGDGDPGADPAPLNKGDGSQFDPKDFVPRSEFEKLETTNKHLFARTTKAEGKLKEKGISLDEAAPPAPSSPTPPANDPISIARQVNALKDFDDQELDFAATLAQGKGVAVTEIVKSLEFETYLKGKRGADFKSSKVPAPGSGGSPSHALPDANAIAKMSKEEHAALDRKAMEQQNGGRGI